MNDHDLKLPRRKAASTRVVGLLSLLIAPMITGCLGPGAFDATPLIARWPTSSDEVETRLGIPFFEHHSSTVFSEKGKTSEWAIHPLIRRVKTEKSLEIQILDPFINYRETEDRRRFYAIPFYLYDGVYPVPIIWYQEVDKPAGTDWDLIAFPFLAGGGASGEPYFGIFPLFGRLRNFIGFESISFFLFPLYYTATKNVTDPNTSYSITPLVGWTRGGVRDGSFRILPFYLHHTWKGKHDKYSVLWPFFHYHQYGLDTDHPSTLFAFWPFFKRDFANNHSFWTILWPFFRFNHETPDRIGALPNEESLTYFHYDLPWPIFRYQKTREFQRLRVFPLFSYFRSDELTSRSFLGPLVWFRDERLKDGIKYDQYLVPLVHRSVTEYDDGRGRDSYLQFWPLMHSDRRADGRYDLSFLSLIPLRKEAHAGDFDANWGVFWNLFRYREDTRGAKKLSALFGLVRWLKNGKNTYFTAGPLYSFRSRNEFERHHQILMGLVSWTSEPALSLRLLGLKVF